MEEKVMEDHRQLTDLTDLALRVEAARAHLVSALGHPMVDLDEVQAARRRFHAARRELHGMVVGRRRACRVGSRGLNRPV